MNNIHWLVPFKLNHPEEILKSDIASLRLRAGLFLLPIFDNYKLTINESISNIDDIDFLFIGKIDSRKELLYQWEQYISYYRNIGVKLFFDCTDNNFGNNSASSKMYEKVLKTNDSIITSSEKLKSNIFPQFKNISVIEDPIEIKIQKVKTNKKNHFLFFGHPTNIPYLLNIIPKWDRSKEYHLTIQTSELGLKFITSESRFINKPENLNIHLQPWSQLNMENAAKMVSGVIIPGDILDDKKNGVSHNRLLTSFALGLPVAATKYNSYLEFENQFSDIDNSEEFKKFLRDPHLFSSRVSTAQKKLKEYSRNKIAEKWLQLLK